ILHGGQRVQTSLVPQHFNTPTLQHSSAALPHSHTPKLPYSLSVASHVPPANFTPSAVPVCADQELFMSPLQVLGQELKVSAVTTGSTHTVILADHLPNDEEFLKLGPAIENHPLFPERTSLIWAAPSVHHPNTPTL